MKRSEKNSSNGAAPMAASPEEAAAIAASIERFMRATAPASSSVQEDADPWMRAAMLEGVEREHLPDVPNSWIYP